MATINLDRHLKCVARSNWMGNVPPIGGISLNGWITHVCGTRKSTGYRLQRNRPEPVQCPTSRNACNGSKESTLTPEVYYRISNSLPTAHFVPTITSQLTLHQHYRIYQLRLGRKPYDSQIGRRMCVWSGTHQCQRRTRHVRTDSLASQVSERHGTLNT